MMEGTVRSHNGLSDVDFAVLPCLRGIATGFNKVCFKGATTS